MDKRSAQKNNTPEPLIFVPSQWSVIRHDIVTPISSCFYNLQVIGGCVPLQIGLFPHKKNLPTRAVEQ